MISGAITATYAFINVVRYALWGNIPPLLFGSVPMAFSTAGLFVVNGLAIFWCGWLIREEAIIKQRPPAGLNPAQAVQLILALISAGSLITVALIGALKR